MIAKSKRTSPRSQFAKVSADGAVFPQVPGEDLFTAGNLRPFSLLIIFCCVARFGWIYSVVCLVRSLFTGRIWLINLWTRIRCRNREARYDVRSSLKELRRAVMDERKLLNVSRIIPGDWGKAESGWLAWPLSSRTARFGSGGRIHQFLWQRSRAVSNAKQELGDEER